MSQEGESLVKTTHVQFNTKKGIISTHLTLNNTGRIISFSQRTPFSIDLSGLDSEGEHLVVELTKVSAHDSQDGPVRDCPLHTTEVKTGEHTIFRIFNVIYFPLAKLLQGQITFFCKGNYLCGTRHLPVLKLEFTLGLYTMSHGLQKINVYSKFFTLRSHRHPITHNRLAASLQHTKKRQRTGEDSPPRKRQKTPTFEENEAAQGLLYLSHTS